MFHIIINVGLIRKEIHQIISITTSWFCFFVLTIYLFNKSVIITFMNSCRYLNFIWTTCSNLIKIQSLMYDGLNWGPPILYSKIFFTKMILYIWAPHYSLIFIFWSIFLYHVYSNTELMDGALNFLYQVACFYSRWVLHICLYIHVYFYFFFILFIVINILHFVKISFIFIVFSVFFAHV